MPKLDVFQPAQVFSSEPPDFSSPAYRLLAEGDSWFSLGGINPLRNSNLLLEMAFRRSAVVVNCASPGDTLKRMSRINTDPNFIDLLCGHRQRLWDGLLISCGGNDLIEALSSPAIDAQGEPVPLDLRLLKVEAEWDAPELGPQRYLSDEGWETFSGYLRANFAHLLVLRDQGLSRGAPVFIHGYAFPTPRPSGSGLGVGPWLLPALRQFGIPPSDDVLVAHELVKRLGGLLQDMADDPDHFPNLHFFDSSSVPLEPALPDATGVSGDWLNEIHLTRTGYRKLGASWAAQIEAVLQRDAPAPVESEVKPTTTVPVDA